MHGSIKRFKQNKVIISIVLFVYAGSVLSYSKKSDNTVNRQFFSKGKFVGNAACKSCHQSVFYSYENTAHNLTSRPASATSIKGSFKTGNNYFSYNRWIEIKLEKKEGKYFQTGYANGQVLESESMDISIGSGRRGQTYLYWKDNNLFQLPVSYFTPMNSWCNSPGFPTNMFKFYRQIPAECLECHATYIETEDEEEMVYNKSSLIYGITCESCHGAGSDHVEYHQKNPGEKKGMYITNSSHLNRQLLIDACAFCHSGIRKHIQPSFSFKVGDKLDEFSIASYSPDSSSQLDVHGNQTGLLMSSKCFQKSEMSCSSCHNVHETQYNAPEFFSQKCMGCHNTNSHKECTLITETAIVKQNNCIDCHMPKLPSSKILLQLQGEQSSYPDYVRTHRIAIYKSSTEEFIKHMNKK
jgi:hypothetical protein